MGDSRRIGVTEMEITGRAGREAGGDHQRVACYHECHGYQQLKE
jgi:hypothetical protein